MRSILKYLKRRGSQPTSWLGLVAIAFTAYTGIPTTPDQIATVLVGLGLIHADA